jgi:hypothetical protein
MREHDLDEHSVGRDIVNRRKDAKLRRSGVCSDLRGM